jgi:hypothetical protein
MRPTLDHSTLSLMRSTPRPAATATPRRRKRIRRVAVIAAIATAAAALTGAGAANAQPLNSVAIATDISLDTLTLDVAGASTSPGAPVIQWYGHGGSNQRWNFVTLPNGNQQIVNQNSGMCLTTNGIAGQVLYQWYCNVGARQEWQGSIPGKFSNAIVKNGGMLVNPATGLAVDIQGASGLAGAGVIGWYQNGKDNQRFHYYQL